MIQTLILERKLLKWKVFLKYYFPSRKLVLNARIKNVYFQVFINWQNLGWFSNRKISAFLGFSQYQYIKAILIKHDEHMTENVLVSSDYNNWYSQINFFAISIH